MNFQQSVLFPVHSTVTTLLQGGKETAKLVGRVASYVSGKGSAGPWPLSYYKALGT